MSSFKLCAEFGLFPDNHILGGNFTLSGFSFTQLGGSQPLFVNLTKGELGLQIPWEGVEIKLPVPVSSTTLRVGTFAGDAKIEVLDSTGQIVQQQVIPGINNYTNIQFAAPEILHIRITEGGNEAILTRICVKACSCTGETDNQEQVEASK